MSIKIDHISTTLPAVIDDMSFSKVGILIDEHTKTDCLRHIAELVPDHVLIEIESGEVNKTLTTCESIWNQMTNAGFDRHSLLINLGGGVIGDMGGFCAVTFKRGIRFINIPTTLLSMVDASVGGKLGIDFNGFKNHLGFFKEPETVLIDPVFLETLPERELRSGFAEVIKHGLIADADYFQSIAEYGLAQSNWNAVIAHSVHIKDEVVKKDPHEKGLRKILNFGHTVGHAIESQYLDTENHLLHGEAIAIGMVCEAYLSKKLCGLSNESLALITSRIIETFGTPRIEKQEFTTIIERMYQDKKNKNNLLNHSLLKSIGEATYDIAVDEKDVLDSLFYYQQLGT